MSSLEEKTTELEKWIKTQPHIPQNMHKHLLKRYVHATYHDVEKAKALLIFGLEIRNKWPNLFFDRDPLSPGTQQLLDVLDLLPLPNLTKEGYKVSLTRIEDSDPNKYDFLEMSRLFYMLYDLLLITPEPSVDDQIPSGDISIHDFAGMQFGHLKKTIYSILKINMKYMQEALPIRITQIHFINMPWLITYFMAIARPFLRKDIEKLIIFHKAGSETLYDYVSKDILPVEYGGNNGSIADIRKVWKLRLESERDYLMDKSNWLMTIPETESKKNIVAQVDGTGFD